MLTRILVVVLMVAGLLLTMSSLRLHRETIERFEVETPAPAGPEDPAPVRQMVIPEGSTPEELTMGAKIIDTYSKVLQRMPSSVEYRTAMLNVGEDLEQKLYNSAEFTRLTKTQTNTTFPELTKIIYDLRLIRKVIEIYKKQLGKEPYPSLRLPLKDAFVYLNHSEAAFTQMLRSPSYPKWEGEMIQNPLVGRIDVEASIEENFRRDTLMRLAAQASTSTATKKKAAAAAAAADEGEVKKVSGEQLVLQKPNVYIITTGGASVSNIKDLDKLVAASASSAGGERAVGEKDTDMQCMLDSIQKQDFRKRLYFDKNDLVLRPEFSWKMPERAPPVCTNPPGSKPVQVAPVLEGSKLLLGTPLEEAVTETGVGSIMPKFEFKEYITI